MATPSALSPSSSSGQIEKMVEAKRRDADKVRAQLDAALAELYRKQSEVIELQRMREKAAAEESEDGRLTSLQAAVEEVRREIAEEQFRSRQLQYVLVRANNDKVEAERGKAQLNEEVERAVAQLNEVKRREGDLTRNIVKARAKYDLQRRLNEEAVGKMRQRLEDKKMELAAAKKANEEVAMQAVVAKKAVERGKRKASPPPSPAAAAAPMLPPPFAITSRETSTGSGAPTSRTRRSSLTTTRTAARDAVSGAGAPATARKSSSSLMAPSASAVGGVLLPPEATTEAAKEIMGSVRHRRLQQDIDEIERLVDSLRRMGVKVDTVAAVQARMAAAAQQKREQAKGDGEEEEDEDSDDDRARGKATDPDHLYQSALIASLPRGNPNLLVEHLQRLEEDKNAVNAKLEAEQARIDALSAQLRKLTATMAVGTQPLPSSPSAVAGQPGGGAIAGGGVPLSPTTAAERAASTAAIAATAGFLEASRMRRRSLFKKGREGAEEGKSLSPNKGASMVLSPASSKSGSSSASSLPHALSPPASAREAGAGAALLSQRDAVSPTSNDGDSREKATEIDDEATLARAEKAEELQARHRELSSKERELVLLRRERARLEAERDHFSQAITPVRTGLMAIARKLLAHHGAQGPVVAPPAGPGGAASAAARASVSTIASTNTARGITAASSHRLSTHTTSNTTARRGSGASVLSASAPGSGSGSGSAAPPPSQSQPPLESSRGSLAPLSSLANAQEATETITALSSVVARMIDEIQRKRRRQQRAMAEDADLDMDWLALQTAELENALARHQQQQRPLPPQHHAPVTNAATAAPPRKLLRGTASAAGYGGGLMSEDTGPLSASSSSFVSPFNVRVKVPGQQEQQTTPHEAEEVRKQAVPGSAGAAAAVHPFGSLKKQPMRQQTPHTATATASSSLVAPSLPAATTRTSMSGMPTDRPATLAAIQASLSLAGLGKEQAGKRAHHATTATATGGGAAATSSAAAVAGLALPPAGLDARGRIKAKHDEGATKSAQEGKGEAADDENEAVLERAELKRAAKQLAKEARRKEAAAAAAAARASTPMAAAGAGAGAGPLSPHSPGMGIESPGSNRSPH